MKFQMVCVNASDLFTVHHFFSAIFLLSAREKNRSRPIFGDGGCVGVGNYSHVSRKFTGEKYRSNVTVPSETEYSPFFFFFLFGRVTHLQSAGQKWEIAKIYKALRRRIGEKNARAFDVLIVMEATFRVSWLIVLFREKNTSGRKCVTVKC